MRDHTKLKVFELADRLVLLVYGETGTSGNGKIWLAIADPPRSGLDRREYR